jgi:hypothetical protein
LNRYSLNKQGLLNFIDIGLKIELSNLVDSESNLVFSETNLVDSESNLVFFDKV